MNERRTLWFFSISGSVIFTLMVIGAAWKQGWFLPREEFTIRFPTANGLYVGTPVLLTGLKIGDVKSVDLNDEGRVEVRVSVLSKYVSQLREDASAKAERTFVIGEKIIALSPGSRDRAQLNLGAELQGVETMEITEILSGGHVAQYFETFKLLMEQLSSLVDVAGSKDQNLASLYSQLHKSLHGVESLAKDVRILRSDVFATEETKMLMSNLAKSSRNMENVMKELNETLPKINAMSGEFQGTMPTLSKALQESVVTLQAMQRSFFLRSGVKEVMEERESRQPASEDKSKSTSP